MAAGYVDADKRRTRKPGPALQNAPQLREHELLSCCGAHELVGLVGYPNRYDSYISVDPYLVLIIPIFLGPIFPRVWKNGKKQGPVLVHHSRKDPDTLITWYFADEDETLKVNLSEDTLQRLLMSPMKLAGYNRDDCKLYLIRKSATKWAARCGGVEWAIKAAGRWKENSKHFSSYIEAGQLDGQYWLDKKDEDPIRKLWVFKPTAVQECSVPLATPV